MAINLTALKTELITDPNGYGYIAGTFTEAAGERNAALLNEPRAGISVGRNVISAREIIDATVPSEWTSLTADEKLRYQTLTGVGEVNVQSTNVRDVFLAMFAGGTQTRANLVALQNRVGSRAEQLFGQSVNFRDVLNALMGS
jgi:hypothetical protein